MKGAFEIDRNNPHVQFLRRMLRSFGVLAAIPSVVMLALGDAEGALIWLIFPISMLTILPWGSGGIGRGSITIDEYGFRQSSTNVSFEFPWEHIRSARIALTGELRGDRGLLRRLLFLSPDYRYVEIDLADTIYMKWRTFGTGGLGLPIFTHKHSCYPKDPAALLAEINMWLDAYRQMQPDDPLATEYLD